jgi:predicted ribosome quality control (RQC) complex YloA/Tae2 family protein
LIGARIRRIDAPSPDLWAMTLTSSEARGTLLVSLQPSASGIGWAEKRPHGQPATSFVQKLRKELEGGRLVALEEVGARFELTISKSDKKFRLAFDFARQNVLLLSDEGLVTSARKAKEHSDVPLATASSAIDRADANAQGEHAGSSKVRDRDAHRGAGDTTNLEAARSGDAERRPLELDLAELAERARELLADRSGALLSLRRSSLLRAVRTARSRSSRKLDAIAGDAKRAEQAPALRQRAQLLLSNLHAIARGATSVRLLDYTLDPPAEVDVALDPKQSPRELAEAWFKRARRFERGATIAAQRSAAGLVEVSSLDALVREIEACTDAETLEVLAQKSRQLGIQGELPEQVAPEKTREPSRHVPYRTLVGSGARVILVGKGASDNDVLTRDHARPHDLWLHARDVAGAHVVVPLEKREVCPQELLLDAAHLAAHFSDSRGEPTVDVSYTPKRYVRKPKGAAPGLVVLEREKVLRLQLEATRLAKLLQNERQ